jgi:glycosyltransferase involved in cell wall biosynthesis
MYREHTIAVVIPALNEAELLPTTLRGLPDFIDHIIVVDDGSTDATRLVTREHERAGVTLISHTKNKGVGKAIGTGYQAAIHTKASLIVVMGADNQMCPTEIPRLLDPLVEGRADYTKGNRLGHPLHREVMPWLRRHGTWLLSYLTQYATGLKSVIDSQCGFTAITHLSLNQLPIERLFPGYGYPNDLLSLLAVGQHRVLDVVVTPIYRSETSNLRIHKVLMPISGILIRALFRRLRNLKQPEHNLSQTRSSKDPIT